MQTAWKTAIDPVLAQPMSQGSILKSVKLASGANVINHLLGRTLQGWVPVRFHGSWAQIFDTQDVNKMPQLTLQLTTSAAVTIDLFVF